MTATRDRLWSVPFVLATATAFLVGIVFWALMTSIALYALESFRASEGVAGFAASSFILGAVFSRAFLSRFIDVVGRRRMLLIGLAVFTLATVAYLVAQTLPVLIAVRLIHGAAFGLAHTTLTTVAMSVIPASRLGEGTGYFGVANAAVTALGPLLAVLMGVFESESAVFLMASACALGALLTALLIRAPEPARAPVSDAPLWRYRLTDIVEPASLGVATVMLLCGGAFTSVMVFVTAHSQALDLAALTGPFFAVYATTVVLSRLLLGRVQDLFGDNTIIYPTFASFIVGLILLGFAPNGTVLLLSAVLLGTGFGAMLTATLAVAVRLAPPARVSIAVSTYYIFLDIGSGLGPMVLGFVAAATGYPGMFLIMAALVAVAGVLYIFVHGTRRGGRDVSRSD